MKRALLATLWIGALAAAVAIGLQLSGMLIRPDAAIAKALGLAPNETSPFVDLLVVAILSFAVAWTMLEVDDIRRRAAIFFLLALEFIGAAWILRLFTISFAPLPGIIAAMVATALVIALDATSSGRQRRSAVRLFRGRLAQPALDRLRESEALDFSQAITRESSFVFCEIANEADLIDELTTADCTQLTREFIELATKEFLHAGGYLHAADGEGIRVLFGFPEKSERHAFDASRAALSLRKSFAEIASSKPDSLGKIDLRIGISSGVIVATARDGVPGGEIVLAGEALAVARRIARANQVYGSQILLGPRTFSAAGKEILARPIDFLRSAEAHQRLEVYELLALAEQASPEEVERRDQFWKAVVYFREHRWNEAFAQFVEAKNNNGATDLPLQWYLGRLSPVCLKMTGEPAPSGEPFAPMP
ncbi:MAG TPA: adenylate/guanylate cyclase domain-containing protein [Chthoniobacterales bacterium]|jgi:class 3 adenylate cyclase